jgi:transcriptional regulator with XRE-family HTH domain
MSTHAEDLKLRLMTIELLRTAKYKRNITYRELATKTGLPVTVLSRYAKGHVLPNTTRAKQLWRVLTKLVGLEAELRSRIKFDDIGYFDNTESSVTTTSSSKPQTTPSPISQANVSPKY